MEQYIRKEKIQTGELTFVGEDYIQKELLIGEVPDVKTNYFIVKKGCTFHAAAESKRVRIIFFIKGVGSVKAGENTFTLSESAVFCPLPENSFILQATTENVLFLEILYELTEEEVQVLSSAKNSGSYFMNYSACTTYKEAIKSEKTINRTLVPEDIVPRFCMGSVETTGPDVVGAHTHPMLEQFFFGLSNNYCSTKADDSEILFEENTLFHIPLGSTHSVRVDQGHILHYLWIDLFKKGNDMSYIRETHIQNGV